jgi:fructuronate reductase
VSAAYRAALLPRFGNPALPHRTAQIATDASLKVPQRLLGPIRDRLTRGQPIDALVVAVAAFLRACGGRDDAGRDFAVNDPAWRAWTEARGGAAVPEPFAGLAARFVFGEDLPGDGRFTRPLRQALDAMARRGVLAALAERFP